MKTHILAFTLSISVCFAARAELKFDKTELELHPAPADKQAVGHSHIRTTASSQSILNL